MRRLFFVFITVIFSISVFPQNSIPNVFKSNKWFEIGEQKDAYINNVLELDNTNWIYPSFGRLVFVEGYYAYGTPWSGIESYGKYTTQNNKIVFTPALIIPRWDEKYSVKELLVTTTSRKDREGKQILVDNNETISFYGYEYLNKASSIVINTIACNEVNIPIRILVNNILYALPSDKSKNLLNSSNYYGSKASISKASIIYKPVDETIEWINITLDFTYDEPIDGGGPYYQGWIQKKYTSEIINHNMIIISDNLRVRNNPNLEENTKVITTLKKWSTVKIIKVGDVINKINEIEDRWYFVALENGTTGWIFGGYAKQYNDENELKKIKELYIKM